MSFQQSLEVFERNSDGNMEYIYKHSSLRVEPKTNGDLAWVVLGLPDSGVQLIEGEGDGSISTG